MGRAGTALGSAARRGENSIRLRHVLGYPLAVVGTIAAVLAGTHRLPGVDTGDPLTGRAIARGLSFATFEISQQPVDALTPGVLVPVELRLTNPHDSPLAVTGVTVRVQRLDAPRASPAHPCTRADFTLVQAADGPAVIVPPQSTSTMLGLGVPRTTLPHIGILEHPRNQDGCKDATLVLAYQATGTLQE